MPLQGLQRELFEPGVPPHVARGYLREALDTTATYEAAKLFGNERPRPPMRAFWDGSLRGSGTLAWYLDPQEVKLNYPREGRQLEEMVGSDPIVALSPDVVRMQKEYASSVITHEKTHGAQQGKLMLKRLHAMTEYGALPIGEMLIEGGVEWAMERRGGKAPSRYMEKESDRKPAYAHFRDFVYELEASQKGIMRQIYRAADRGGMNAVTRLLESVPGMNMIVEKYASKLLNMKMN
jgi:hypothetical protein